LGEKVRQFWKDNLQKREETTIKQRVTYNTRATQGAYLLTNQHLSEVMSNKLLNNERIWQRGEYKAIKCPKTCRYKSSYELTIMQDLDASDAVASWNYECVSIRYIDETEHKTRRYVPDFLITLKSGKIIMLEAKPFKLSTHPRVMCKTKAGVAYCKEMNITYIMWWPEMGSIDEVLQHKTLKDKDTQP